MRYNISIIKNLRLGAGHLCGSDYIAENITDMWNILRRERDCLTEEELKNGVAAFITEAEYHTLPNGTRFNPLYKNIVFRLNSKGNPLTDSKGKIIMKDVLK